MKRLCALMFLVAIAVSIPLSHDVSAAKEEQVNICHATGVISDGGSAQEGGNCVNIGGVFDGEGVPEGDNCGIVISINPNAASVHCAHGDRGTGLEPGPGACRLDLNDVGEVCAE